MASLLNERMDAVVVEERMQALRSLLQHPLLTTRGAREQVALIRRHAEHLRRWLDRFPGWHLHLDQELARLVKTPAMVGDASHPARDPQHRQPFTRRRYVLLCLALASCERAGRQTTLRRLCEYLQTALASDQALLESGLSMDPQRREDRSDLVAIGRYLVDYQVITRIHGDEEAYVAGSGDCLYSVNRAVLARMLCVRQGPSQIPHQDFAHRLEALQAEPSGEGEESRRRAIRQRLVRLLLEHPVMYYADLSEDERGYFQSQRPLLLRELTQATGLIAEVRCEGVALVDAENELTDFRLPQEGTDGHAALLLAGYLVEQMRLHPGAVVPQAAVEAELARCASLHGQRWRRDACTIDGTSSLARELVQRLADLDLVRIEGAVVRPLPALARYGLQAPGPDDALADEVAATTHAPADAAPGSGSQRTRRQPTQQSLFPNAGIPHP